MIITENYFKKRLFYSLIILFCFFSFLVGVVLVFFFQSKNVKVFPVNLVSFDADGNKYYGRFITDDGKKIEYDALAISNYELNYKKLYIFLDKINIKNPEKIKKIALFLYLNYSDKTYNNIKINICFFEKGNISYLENGENIKPEEIILKSNSKKEFYFKIEKTKINSYKLPLDRKNGFLEFDISELKDKNYDGIIIYINDYNEYGYNNINQFNMLTYVNQLEFSGPFWSKDRKLRKYAPYIEITYF